MAKIRTLQILRGTTVQNDAYTGFAGELTMDTTTNELRLHDGSTAGGHVIGSGGSGGYHPNLFDVKWADHICNDVQWLRADTFSWQSGAVYQVAYQHLADDIDGKTLQSETVAGTTIQFYLADDGHKICPDTEESNVTAIYNATGVAWYYIIDTVNTRFKLPRTKFGLTGLRDTVGKYVEAGLPNITGSFITRAIDSSTGAFSQAATTSSVAGTGSVGSTPYKLSFDASDSSSVYGNSTTVQAPATQMYLYFYVGSFTQTALENTAGLNASLFNGKVDLDFNNTAMIDYVIEKQDPTAGNNYTWYRKYKSGWVEQGGLYTNPSATTSSYTQSLPVAMANANYQVTVSVFTASPSVNYYAPKSSGRTTTSFAITPNASQVMWEVRGIAAN